MAVPATEFETEYSMEIDARLARLDERTEHLQRDVTEIKGDLRRLDSKVDALGQRLDTKIDALGNDVNSKIDALTLRHPFSQ